MSIKTDAIVIRDEVAENANTATRVGSNLVAIADDLETKQAEIDLNTAKETNVPYDDSALQAEVDSNTAKVGITPTQASDITTNNAKVSNVDHPLVETAVPVGAVFTDTDTDTVYDDTAIQAEVDLNTAKTGITAQQSADITSNNAKVSFDSASSTKLDGIEVGATADQDLSGKQDVLVSGTNIKTINSTSILGAGNINIDAGSVEGTEVLSTGEAGGSKFLREDGDGTASWQAITGGGDALVASPLSQFAQTTKAQLNSVISDGTPLYVGDVTGVTTELKPTDIDTIAELNAIVTDATLIDTADARLSDARTPTAHTHSASEVTDFDTEVANNSAVALNTAKNSYPSADSTKVGNISVTQAVNLDTIESDVATNTSKVGVTSEISNLVEDTTPQLGGNLDLNGNTITGIRDEVNDRLEEDTNIGSAKNVDWTSYEVFDWTLTEACVLTDINLPSVGSKTIIIRARGTGFALTFPAGWDGTFSSGTYDTSAENLIVVQYIKSTTPIYTLQITQA